MVSFIGGDTSLRTNVWYAPVVISGEVDILRALKSPDEENRRRAIFLVAQGQDYRSVPVLEELAAQDPSIEVRYYAKKALLFLQQNAGGPKQEDSRRGGSPVGGVREALQDADPALRNRAVQALAKQGGEQALALLTERCGVEEDSFVRASLAIALGILGGGTQLSLLRGFLDDPDPRVRANAIEGLMHLGIPEVIRVIVPHLKDQDKRVKVNAYTAMGRFGKLALLRSLGEMLNSDKLWLRDVACYALCKLELPESVALLEHAFSDDYIGVRLKARNGLVGLARKGVSQAEKALERAGGERGAPEDYLTMSMLAPRQRVAMQAADPTEAGLALIRRIVEAEDRKHLSMLLKQLAKERSPRIVATLLTAVGKLGDGQVLNAVCPFLTATDRRIRANAVEAVGYLAGARSDEFLRPFLTDPDNRVRANAIVAVGANPQVDLTDPLTAMATSVQELMRLSSIYAVVELRRPAFLSLLEELLLDPIPQVRKKAVDSLRILAADGLEGAGGILQQAGLPLESLGGL
jgi:HEAT repeat protein